jgi:hypothetical protein
MPDTAPDRRRARRGIGADLLIPALGVGFTAYYLWTVWDLSWEATADGLVVGTVLLGLIGMLVARMVLRVARGQATLRFEALTAPARPQIVRLELLAATVLFIVAMSPLGFTLSTFLFMNAAMLILGVLSARALLALSAAVAGGGYALFILFLGTRFPRGVVEHLLARLF